MFNPLTEEESPSDVDPDEYGNIGFDETGTEIEDEPHNNLIENSDVDEEGHEDNDDDNKNSLIIKKPINTVSDIFKNQNIKNLPIVPAKDRKTKPFLTSYEKTKIMAIYITHRKNGQPSFIECPENISYEEEARLAINMKVLPYIVIRVVNNKKEKFSLSELHVS